MWLPDGRIIELDENNLSVDFGPEAGYTVSVSKKIAGVTEWPDEWRTFYEQSTPVAITEYPFVLERYDPAKHGKTGTLYYKPDLSDWYVKNSDGSIISRNDP